MSGRFIATEATLNDLNVRLPSAFSDPARHLAADLRKAPIMHGHLRCDPHTLARGWLRK
jgi:hypothetical protein